MADPSATKGTWRPERRCRGEDRIKIFPIPASVGTAILPFLQWTVSRSACGQTSPHSAGFSPRALSGRRNHAAMPSDRILRIVVGLNPVFFAITLWLSPALASSLTWMACSAL